jgi:hypothetical protein
VLKGEEEMGAGGAGGGGGTGAGEGGGGTGLRGFVESASALEGIKIC